MSPNKLDGWTAQEKDLSFGARIAKFSVNSIDPSAFLPDKEESEASRETIGEGTRALVA
jgi:hypothetical protein